MKKKNLCEKCKYYNKRSMCLDRFIEGIPDCKWGLQPKSKYVAYSFSSCKKFSKINNVISYGHCFICNERTSDHNKSGYYCKNCIDSGFVDSFNELNSKNMWYYYIKNLKCRHIEENCTRIKDSNGNYKIVREYTVKSFRVPSSIAGKKITQKTLDDL